MWRSVPGLPRAHMATHIFTSIAANYLPKARVLAHSVKKFHPDFLFHVVLCDARPDWFSLEQEPFDSLITLDDLGLENPEQWIFKHTLVELSTGVKGFALEKLLGIPGCTEVLFLDPDIVVLAPLDRLLAEFGNASILLTPHIAEPETTLEAILDNELSVLQHGIYNLGFIGVKNSPEGRRFARWWADRLNHFCYEDIPGGMFTDQRWADLVPAYFPDHKILRDPAYNVCTWNLTHRAITGSLRDGLLVNGQPVVFYHFSGFDSGAQQGMLDKYGNSMPALYELREWYIAECERLDQSRLSKLRWAYGFFDNGERILNIHRRRYRERIDLQAAFPNPYSTRDVNHSYLHWFNLHDDSRLALQKTPASTDSPATRDYRVFVLAAPEDASLAQSTLELISERTLCRDEIFFVAGRLILSRVQVPPGIQAVELESDRYDDLFAAVLDRFADKDAVLIRAGAVPPQKWDLRLAWSAVRQPGVATVSPIDERLLDKSATLRLRGGDDLLDRLCYWHRQAADLEVSSFSRDCVYVRADAVRAVSGVEKRFHPSDLLDGAGRLRYSHLLATHICMSWRRPRSLAPVTALDSNAEFFLARLHYRIRAHSHAKSPTPAAVVKSMTGRNLHIMHSWGAGLERWVADYCRADREHNNFVLKSFGSFGAWGKALHLYRRLEDPEPLQMWQLQPPIKATETARPAYQDILSDILEQYGIRRIIVSSLIGHSLDALRQPRRTIFVCHDYYPFCPAFNITFGEVCRSCEEPRLNACTQDNPHNRFFPNVPPAEWLHLRKEFTAAVQDHAVTLVAPSPSVRDNYTRLAPELAASFRVIPHGTAAIPAALLDPVVSQGSPLRVVILGSLAPHKGGLLLECMVGDLLRFSKLMLVGCGDYGKPYAENPAITVIPEYRRDRLPELIADLKPDIGLLLSVVPETFSYTLQEFQDLRIPVLATGIGSFLDRIQDGVTGLLCAPEPAAIVERLKNVAEDGQVLRRIHDNLKKMNRRSAEEMLQDYEALDPTCYSPGAYFDSSKSPQPLPESSLQLFWRGANVEYREKDSVTVAPLGRERQITRLYVFASEPIQELRLDLSFQPGFFLLHNLCLHDLHDRVLWTWDGTIAPLKSSFCNQMLFLTPRQGESPALLYFMGTDPYLTLPIQPGSLADLKTGGYLEIEFALAAAANQIEAPISSAATLEQVMALHLDLQVTLSERDRQTEQLQRDMRERDSRVQELETHIAAVENSTSWRVTRPARGLVAVGRRIKRILTAEREPSTSD